MLELHSTCSFSLYLSGSLSLPYHSSLTHHTLTALYADPHRIQETNTYYRHQGFLIQGSAAATAVETCNF